MDVVHAEHGPGWVWGSGVGRVTVRFETAETRPGRCRTFRVDDPELVTTRPRGHHDEDAGATDEDRRRQRRVKRTCSPGPQLGALPQVGRVHDRDHRVAAGRRVVGEEHQRLARRRHLHRAEHQPLAGQLALPDPASAARPRAAGRPGSTPPTRRTARRSACARPSRVEPVVARAVGQPQQRGPRAGRARPDVGAAGRGGRRRRPAARRRRAAAAARRRRGCRSTGTRAPAAPRCRRRPRRRSGPRARPARRASVWPSRTTTGSAKATARATDRHRAGRAGDGDRQASRPR